MGKIRWLHISDLHYDREMMGDWPAGQNGFPVTGIDFIVLREICILTEEITTKENGF